MLSFKPSCSLSSFTFINRLFNSFITFCYNSGAIRQKDMTLKDELPRCVEAQYATGESGEIAPERMKRLNQKENNAQLWM